MEKPRRSSRFTGIRMPASLNDRIERIMHERARQGLSVPRTAVIRAAIERGLDILDPPQRAA
jgi:predicted DNA-binding protein